MLKQEAAMVPFSHAVGLVEQMRKTFYSSLAAETVPTLSSLDRRLASDVHASSRSPRFNVSTVDGYAVKTSGGYPFRVLRDIYAGDRGTVSLDKGEAAYVATGAAVPRGADAVLKIEEVAVDKGTIVSGPQLEAGANLINAGSDFEAGDRILEKDTVIGPSAICVLCAAGVDSVSIYRRIRVGVLSTGDEIKNGMVNDCNAPMVCAMLRRWGCESMHVGVVPDDASETKAMLDNAATRFDVVITIGGISVGKKDLVISTIRAGGDIVFRGYRLRPGKPLLVSYYRGKPVFSLPGKPTASFTSMELIVKRFVLGDARDPSTTARLARDVDIRTEDFEQVVYVQLKDGVAVPMGYAGSPLELFPGPQYRVSLVSSSPMAIVADGYFMARESLKAGDEVNVTLL